MSSWPRVPLSKVAEVAGGDSAPQAADAFAPDGTPFVRMQDVGRYGRTDNLTKTTDRVSETTSARLKLFPKGSILVPKSGASIRLNHRAILGVDAHVVSHLAVITPRQINGRFLYYWLSCVDMGKVAPESDYPSLRLGDLAQVMVPLPSPEEQEHIVHILDEAEEILRRRVQADSRTVGLLDAIFDQMFGESSTNPKQWPVRVLGELIANGPQNGLYKHSSFYGSGTPILRIDAFHDGTIHGLSSLKRLQLTPEELIKYQLQENDILINRVNSPEYLGKSALIRGLKEATVFESNMMRFAVKLDLLDPVYLICLLQTPAARSHILSRAKDAINQSSINQGDVCAFPVPVPPISLQHAFAECFEQVRKLEAVQATSRHRLTDLFHVLLHRAFLGDL